MKNIVWQKKRELKKILRTFNYPYKLKSVAHNIPIYRVTFEHRHIQSLGKRIADWFEYFGSVFDSVFDYLITPKKKRHGILTPMKPIHFKSSCMPISEAKLTVFLEEKNFKIIEEDLGNTYTAYDISKI